MAGQGSCSWYEFAMEIFRQAVVITRVMASNSETMSRPATRPANSVLGSGRSVPITLPEWQRGLVDYLVRREQPEPEEPERKRSSASRRQPVLPLHDEKAEEDEDAEGEETSPEGKAEDERPEGEETADDAEVAE
jgi:hypothetical protein